MARREQISISPHRSEVDERLFVLDYEQVVDAFERDPAPFDGTTFVAEGKRSGGRWGSSKLFRPYLSSTMKARGVRTLFLQTGNWRIDQELVQRSEASSGPAAAGHA